MLHLGRHGIELGGGMSRRHFLSVGSLALGGLTLPDVFRLRAAQSGNARRDTAVILYWMAGGPSHLDTYDLKPAAPAEVRGPFRATPTRVKGLSLCELLPRQAKIADRFSVVRSLRHNNGNHFDAAHWVQTGYHEKDVMGRGQPYPAQGAVVSRLRGATQAGMPPYVCIPDPYSPRLGFYQKAAYLGAQHDPLSGGGEPAYRGKRREPEFTPPREVSHARTQNRQALLKQLDRAARRTEANPSFQSLDRQQQRAFELVTSPRVKRAFDLTSEPGPLHDRYGRHPWGQAALLARRLVEAGVTFVTINHYEADVDWWDDHFDIEKNLRRRLPLFDQALAALIADLHDRGQAERVLVVACGEFGRGPRIDKFAGRGHWPYAGSALMSGGGLRSGQVVGSTSADGGQVRDRPLGPGDLLATIYRVLAVDAGQSLPDQQNRPVRLVESGEAIEELF